MNLVKCIEIEILFTVRHKKETKKIHRFQNFIAFNIKAKWILCGTMTIRVILNLWNIFELGITSKANIKWVFDYLLSIFVNIPENHRHRYFFVDLSVGGAHLCDSMKLFVVLLPFWGLVYCTAAPTDIEKRSAMGLYMMMVYFFCSLYFVFKMFIFFSDFSSP